MKEITSIDSKEIVEFTNLRKTKNNLNSEKEIIIISSKKVLDKAILSGLKIDKIFVAQKYIEEYSRFTNLFYAKKEVMEKIIGYKLHQGIFASAIRPKYKLLNELDSKVLILNGLTSPENVGSITRTAVALGFCSIIFDAKSCSPYLQRCIRVSMGNLFYTKIFKSSNLLEDLHLLKCAEYKIYSTANIKNALDLKNFEPQKKFALIIGSEGHGIDQEILDISDTVLKINISDKVMHLNAAQAASIVMFSLSS